MHEILLALMPNHPPETVIIDTNIWISSIIEDEQRHFESVRNIGVYEKQNYIIYIPQLIIFEIISVMRRENYPRHIIRNFIDRLLCNIKYKVICLDFEEICQLGIDYPDKISLKANDYQFFLYCVKFKPDRIETYDKQLIKHLNAKDKRK